LLQLELHRDRLLLLGLGDQPLALVEDGEVRVVERLVGLELDQLLPGFGRGTEVAVLEQRARESVPRDRELRIERERAAVEIDGFGELPACESLKGLALQRARFAQARSISCKLSAVTGACVLARDSAV
jgi:hypothetical protein